MPEGVVQARDYGVRCDGVTDDSAALARAEAAAARGGFLLMLPEGTCRITRPLIFAETAGSFPSMQGAGTGTVILADYRAWHSADHAAVEVVYPEAAQDLAARAEQIFGNFLIEGRNNSGLPDTVGLSLRRTAPAMNARGQEAFYGPYLARFENIEVFHFDTCYAVDEASYTDFESIAGSGCRVGFDGTGSLINDLMHGARFDFGSVTATSRRGATTGLLLNGRTVPVRVGAPEYEFPQGMDISDSVFLNYSVDLDFESALSTDVHDSIIDFSLGGPAIRLFNPQAVDLHDNYIHVAASAAAIEVEAPSAPQRALWIRDNDLTGSGARGQMGIDFAGGGSAWSDVHVTGNHLEQFAAPIVVAQALRDGTISDNDGSGNTGPFLDLSQAALTGFTIENNHTDDRQPVVRLGGALPASVTMRGNTSGLGAQ